MMLNDGAVVPVMVPVIYSLILTTTSWRRTPLMVTAKTASRLQALPKTTPSKRTKGSVTVFSMPRTLVGVVMSGRTTTSVPPAASERGVLLNWLAECLQR